MFGRHCFFPLFRFCDQCSPLWYFVRILRKRGLGADYKSNAGCGSPSCIRLAMSPLLMSLPTLSLQDSLLSVVTSGVVGVYFCPNVSSALTVNVRCVLQLVHIVFKIWEPMNALLHIFTFLMLPIVLSSVLSAHFGAFVATLLGFALFYGSLFTSIALYRLSPFHPCYRYPGPIGCKLSKLYLLYKVNRGTQHHYLKQLHERYGDVVRIGKWPRLCTPCFDLPSASWTIAGPNEISIRDASVINPLMGSQGLTKGKSTFYVFPPACASWSEWRNVVSEQTGPVVRCTTARYRSSRSKTRSSTRSGAKHGTVLSIPRVSRSSSRP